MKKNSPNSGKIPKDKIKKKLKCERLPSTISEAILVGNESSSSSPYPSPPYVSDDNGDLQDNDVIP